jgi:hypothetical protein
LQREYAKFIPPKKTTPLPFLLPNRIDDPAVNRTGKSVDNRISLQDIQSIIASQETKDIDPAELLSLINKRKTEATTQATTTTTTTTTLKPRLSVQEFEQTRQALQREEAAYNQNLKLLSTLLGRPVSPDEVQKLAQQITPSTPAFRPMPPTTRRTTTTTTTTRRTTPQARDSEELDQLKYIQDVLSTQQATTVAPDFYGKSNDALLAALLKQRGLSPINNDLPLNVSDGIEGGFL